MKRYSIDWDIEAEVEDEDGEWVRYKDVKELEDSYKAVIRNMAIANNRLSLKFMDYKDSGEPWLVSS